jgi:hypothetical protein
VSELRIVTPQEAQEWAEPGWRSPINASFAEDLLHTVATEHERRGEDARAAVVKELRQIAQTFRRWQQPAEAVLIDRRANAIQNGATL